MSRLLIVANQPSLNTKELAEHVRLGAISYDDSNIDVKMLEPLAATSDDVLKAEAIIIGSTENFGYMSGQIKDFFERVYYPCLEKKQGVPYALYIRAGLDGKGAVNSIERIITGLKWKKVHHNLVLKGEYQSHWKQDCFELGKYLSAGVDVGVF